ncbi:MAG: DUF6788 family protein [Planctomycetota bacterium]|jgi:hypothetical protein
MCVQYRANSHTRNAFISPIIWYNICISGNKRKIPRTGMSPRERDRRSRLAQLAHGAGLLRGSLAIRERACGKSNCKCAKGEKHVSLYLVAGYGALGTRRVSAPGPRWIARSGWYAAWKRQPSAASLTDRKRPWYPIGCGLPRFPVRGRLQTWSYAPRLLGPLSADGSKAAPNSAGSLPTVAGHRRANMRPPPIKKTPNLATRRLYAATCGIAEWGRFRLNRAGHVGTMAA